MAELALIIAIYSEYTAPLLVQCLGAMCDAAAGSGERGGRNKCPLCRSPFTSADVVGGTELEAARKDATKEDSGAAAGVTNSEKRMKIPPKVAALLQRLVV